MNIKLSSKNLKNYLVIAGYTLLVISYTLLVYNALGAKQSMISSLLFAFIIPLFFRNKWFFWCFTLPVSVLLAFYYSIGERVGIIKYDYVIALFNTDMHESLSFSRTLDTRSVMVGLLIIPIALLIRKILKTHIDPMKSFYYNASIMLICAFFIYNPLIEFPNKLYISVTEATDELTKLNQINSQKNSWGKLSSDGEYDTYVLIIGEMVRADYMSVYGFPIQDTPFLSKVNGTFVTGYKSADTHTIPSLRIMLTYQKDSQEKPQANYDLNLIKAANNADFETYWVSNQNFSGVSDTPITAIANNARHVKFTKLINKASNDTDVLPFVKHFIRQKINRKKLIVIHLYDAHGYDFLCGQNSDVELSISGDILDRNAACYYKAIMKTDYIISEIYKGLSNKHSKFSILYFSDHGAAERHFTDDKLYFSHADDDQAGYKIPLIKIDSNDKNRVYIESKGVGTDFTDGLLNWLSIQSPTIKFKNDLFNINNDWYVSKIGKEKISFINSLPDKTKPIAIFSLKDSIEYDSQSDIVEKILLKKEGNNSKIAFQLKSSTLLANKNRFFAAITVVGKDGKKQQIEAKASLINPVKIGNKKYVVIGVMAKSKDVLRVDYGVMHDSTTLSSNTTHFIK